MANDFDFNESGYVYSGDFNFGYGFNIYKIVPGVGMSFTSVWADPTANINTAKLYIGTSGNGATFSVIDLQHKVLVDYYTLTHMGENEEFLDREDIIDINVSTVGV